MKTLAIALTIATMGVAGVAHADWKSNLYVQGNLGSSKFKLDQDAFTDPNNGVQNSALRLEKSDTSFRVAVGKDLGAVRVAADYTNFGTWENRSSNANFGVSNYSDDTDIQSIGISAYYDVEQFRLLNGKLTPYVGARLGYVDYDRDFNYVYANGAVAAGSGSDSDVGYGIIGGVQYALMPNIAIDANVEYHDLGSYDVKDVVSMDYSQKGFNVGVRYNF